MSELGKVPDRGRLAGIDFGTVRIGVAICDPDRIVSSPLVTYERRNEVTDGQFFRRLVSDERIVGFIVGLPVHMSGDESEKSRAARQFGEWLSNVTGLSVWFQDERFTTSEANQHLASTGRRQRRSDPRRDMLAAQAILARFLETREHRPPEPLEDTPRPENK